MTEEEKRRLALSIFEQEKNRLANTRFRDHQLSEISDAHRRIARNQALFASLAQQGISWQNLKDAYDTSFALARRELLTFRFSFFYAATAIAYHERFDTGPEATASFMRALPEVPTGCPDRESLIARCIEETGVDTAYADDKTRTVRTTRKDRAAVERMRKTGISEKDLALERQAGYRDGWNESFHLSSCYAALALTLHRQHSLSAVEIEAFLERVAEITDDEITTADIIERAINETGVDVSEIAQISE